MRSTCPDETGAHLIVAIRWKRQPVAAGFHGRLGYDFSLIAVLPGWLGDGPTPALFSLAVVLPEYARPCRCLHCLNTSCRWQGRGEA